MLNKYGRVWLFLAALAVSGASANAGATTISLGSVSAATTLGFSSSGLSGDFEDLYSFTIDVGKTFDVSSFASTGLVTRYGIEDFAGTLFDSGGVLGVGIATTRTSPEGFPAYELSFDPVVLDAGDYTLKLTGTGFGAFPGITAAYNGSLTFADAGTAVPEPGSLALVGLALTGLGLSRRIRRPC